MKPEPSEIYLEHEFQLHYWCLNQDTSDISDRDFVKDLDRVGFFISHCGTGGISDCYYASVVKANKQRDFLIWRFFELILEYHRIKADQKSTIWEKIETFRQAEAMINEYIMQYDLTKLGLNFSKILDEIHDTVKRLGNYRDLKLNNTNTGEANDTVKRLENDKDINFNNAITEIHLINSTIKGLENDYDLKLNNLSDKINDTIKWPGNNKDIKFNNVNTEKDIIKPQKPEQLSLQEIGFLFACKGERINSENCAAIAKQNGWNSGQKLTFWYNKYRKREGRINDEGNDEKNKNRVTLFERIIDLLAGDPPNQQKTILELKDFKKVTGQ